MLIIYSMNANWVLVRVGSENELVWVRDGPFTLGTHSVSDHRLDPRFCSPFHAIIRATATSLTIEDNNSTNGIFLNSRRLERGSTRLEHGDSIGFGSWVTRDECMAEREHCLYVVVRPAGLLQPPIYNEEINDARGPIQDPTITSTTTISFR